MPPAPWVSGRATPLSPHCSASRVRVRRRCVRVSAGTEPDDHPLRDLTGKALRESLAQRGATAARGPGDRPAYRAPSPDDDDLAPLPADRWGPSATARSAAVSGSARGGTEATSTPVPLPLAGQSLLPSPLALTPLIGGPGRAASAQDAGLLKRKGRLLEQDPLIELVLSMHRTHTPAEAFAKLETWVREHRRSPHGSRLRRLVPGLGSFHTHLPLTEALEEYDAAFLLSRRTHVPPNFAEVRHVLDLAQASGAHTQHIITHTDPPTHPPSHPPTNPPTHPPTCLPRCAASAAPSVSSPSMPTAPSTRTVTTSSKTAP